MKKIRILNIIMLMISAFLIFNSGIVNAASSSGLDWWNKASGWYDGGSTTVGISSNVIDGIADMLEIVGTGVIAIATVVLGIKYMLGTVQGKADAKESMINLLVACLFFFGWSGIRSLLITGNPTASNGLTGATKLIFFNGDLKVTFASIFTLLVTLGKFLSVFVIGYMGVKYVFAGADAKAQLKQKSPAVIIGVILIFCALTFLSFVSTAVSNIV